MRRSHADDLRGVESLLSGGVALSAGEQQRFGRHHGRMGQYPFIASLDAAIHADVAGPGRFYFADRLNEKFRGSNRVIKKLTHCTSLHRIGAGIDAVKNPDDHKAKNLSRFGNCSESDSP